ncbi:MAG: PAS domain-containing sensor histidine kinase [Ferruginibacter sp.]
MQTIQNTDRAIFNHASMGIVVINSKGIIVSVNPFALDLFKYTLPEVKDQPIELLIPARYQHKHVGHRETYMKHPKKRPMGVGLILFAIRKDGVEFPVEVSLGNYLNNGEEFGIAFISDISIRKKAEDDLVNFKDNLESTVEQRTRQLTETMQELQVSKEELTKALSKEKELSDLKSRFVSMASHEFRTPLSTILSSASLLAKYTESDEQEKRNKHIHRIKASVNNLTSLLDEFLSIGKMEDGKIIANNVMFNLRDMIELLCSEMKAIAKTGQQFIYVHTGDENIFSDPSLLRNIMTNLLSNAIKFSPEVSTIEITSKVRTNEIKLTVKDSGMGIPQKDQEYLFGRFFRAANVINIQGTGLGLHIVSKYVEILEGKIEFESVLEKGTTFMLTLKKEQH